jgi:hypothetical protein
MKQESGTLKISFNVDESMENKLNASRVSQARLYHRLIDSAPGYKALLMNVANDFPGNARLFNYKDLSENPINSFNTVTIYLYSCALVISFVTFSPVIKTIKITNT